MADVAIAQSNWVAGELSQQMRGRYDLPVYQTGSEKLVNFVSETAGPARFRSGFQFVNPTRRNQVACLIPFTFNEEQSYELELTQNYIRFYQNNQVLTLTPKTITGITSANPMVVTSNSHGYSNGDEVIIQDVGGMARVNGRNFVVNNVTSNTYELWNTTMTAGVNGTTFGTYTSGGQSLKIYEVQTPYLTADLFSLKHGQNADVVYIVHPNYEPRKLTRLGNTNWTLALFSRTGDPFLVKKTISGATQANPASITATAHGFVTGNQVIIETVVGMTQLNSKLYTITKIDADTFTLDGVNSTAYSAYVSGGYASNQDLLPGAVCFYQGRIVYGYSDAYPQSFWGSKPLDTSGNPQYDDLTIGVNPADAYKFTLSPTRTGSVDRIQSLVPTLNFLAICTLEGISKADGGSPGTPISPSQIDISPAVTYGVLKDVTPLLLGINLVFVHRSGRVIYSLEYDIFYSAYNASDKNLSNEHITQSGVKQMVFRNGRPPMFMYVRNDGILVGTTFMAKENINGGHRHILGGTSTKVLSVGIMPRANEFDQTWAVVEQTINGETVRSVQYQNDEVLLPERDDYYTGKLNEVADEARWRNAMFEAQKGYVFNDCNLTYNGSDYATVTMTPGASTGDGVTFIAGGAVFTASMVGREIWKKSVDGVGTGRAVITAYNSSTSVTCNILSDFDSLSAIPIDGWYLTTNTIQGLWFLEGEAASVITDGGEHASQTVTNGQITLQYQASVVHVGEPYRGIIKSMAVEAGGVNGTAQGKPKNINRMAVHFLNTLGAKFGSSLYNLQEIEFRTGNDSTGRPSPTYTGTQRIPFEDTTEVEKHVYIVQERPLPCTVLLISPFVDTDNE